MFEEHHRRTVGPVEVVEEDHQWTDGSEPRKNVTHAHEQIATLLVCGGLCRRSDVCVATADVWQQAGHLGRGIVENSSKLLRARAPLDTLEHLDERRVRV